MLNLLGRIFDVPAGLILRTQARGNEVLARSRTGPETVQSPAAAAQLEQLCRETAAIPDKVMFVENALQLGLWDGEPNVPGQMTSFLGVSLNWPDGKVFGTICVLDVKPVKYDHVYRSLILTFGSIIEDDLRLLAENGERQESVARLEKKVGDLQEFNEKLIDREMRIIEIKKEVNALCGKLGLPLRYPQWAEDEK